VRRRNDWFRRRPRIHELNTLGRRAVTYRPRRDFKEAVDFDAAVERGRRVAQGTYESFGHEWRTLPTGHDAWSTHPRTGYRFTSDVWWKVPHLPPGTDIKDVWEAGRFSWVYDLIRAYSVTEDPTYSAAFHRTFRDWCESNPPFLGVQWACGQETAIRAIAVLHAEDALPAPPDDPDAAARIVRVLGWSGERIADAIGYGLSQRNNHGLSESAGLIHIGLRLLDVHPAAARWLELGRQRLEEQVRDQFYEDGWYAQHSFTYLRFALEQVLLAQHALSARSGSLSSELLDRLRSSVRFLALLLEPSTGLVPNHGANDGGRLVAYSAAPFRDFRPLLTLASAILDIPLPADIAPDGAVVAWLRGGTLNKGPAIADGVYTGESGWAVARVGSTFAFMAAGSYRHRPSHMDMLHLDVRIAGAEVVLDPGTFAYNAPLPWNNALTSAVFHNGPVLDGAEPAERGPRFFWYTWPEAQIVATSYQSGKGLIVATLSGRAQRRVEVDAHGVAVSDSVLDPQVAVLEVNWLVNPGAAAVLEADGSETIDATEGSPLAWFSPTYGHRQAMKVVRARATRSQGRLEVAMRMWRPR
jgi:hypothetical protein